MKTDDQQLVSRMLAGEQRAFDEFFATYARRLSAFAARRSGLDHDALEDIVQNSLIKAIRGLGGFRGEAALFTWLCEICRHELCDLHRGAARRPDHFSIDRVPAISDSVLALLAPQGHEPLAELESMQARTAVRAVLNALPPQFSQALEHKYGDGLSVDEIGQMLGITTIAAQSLLARARIVFRERWRERLEMDAEQQAPPRKEARP